MTETKFTPVTPVFIEKECACGGVFKFTGKSPSNQGSHHECAKCEKVVRFRFIYPYVSYLHTEDKKFMFEYEDPSQDKGIEEPEGDQDGKQ
jgi:hypothetical protein